MANERAGLQTIALAAGDSLPHAFGRQYLMIVAVADAEVQFDEQTETFTVPAGKAWEPDVVPVNKITIKTGTAKAVVA